MADFGPAGSAPNRLQRWLVCDAPYWLVALVMTAAIALLTSPILVFITGFSRISVLAACLGFLGGFIVGCMCLYSRSNRIKVREDLRISYIRPFRRIESGKASETAASGDEVGES